MREEDTIVASTIMNISIVELCHCAGMSALILVVLKTAPTKDHRAAMAMNVKYRLCSCVRLCIDHHIA